MSVRNVAMNIRAAYRCNQAVFLKTISNLFPTIFFNAWLNFKKMQFVQVHVVQPVIFNLGRRWSGVASFTPRPIYPRTPETAPVRKLNTRNGGSTSWSGRFEKK